MPAQGASWLATSKALASSYLSFFYSAQNHQIHFFAMDMISCILPESDHSRFVFFSFGSPFLYAWRQGNLLK
jgi:hypothetical protein